jgi:starvation-inducible DNA-binding protein
VILVSVGDLIELLNTRLAESLDLGLQARHAHWNISGVQFAALHEMFGQLYADLDRYADLLAERIVQLGGTAKGTKWAVLDYSQLAAYPLSIEGAGHVAALGAALAFWSSILGPSIGVAADLNDSVTVDILTEIARGVEKWRWLVESNAQ